MVVVGAGVMAHSLIPPTPGPLFVAEELGIDLGAMIMGGLAVGIITTLSGYAYAVWANNRWDLPLRDTPDITIEELKSQSDKVEQDLPGIWISILPIILPLVLITGNTLLNMIIAGNQESGLEVQMLNVFSIIGDSNIALTISACIALYLLWSRLKNVDIFKKYIGESLKSAGIIILITASGGAFGQMLQQTGIGIRVESLAANYQMAVLPLAFVITAVVRTAQGSATVAMVTAIGVMSGFTSAGLQFHPVYLALVIGCGSKIFAWMNDSAFWIISQMSGMDEKETVRHFSFLLMVMGISGLIAVMILAKVFPFV
jgi:GntP family gluconate:H+ symporter